MKSSVSIDGTVSGRFSVQGCSQDENNFPFCMWSVHGGGSGDSGGSGSGMLVVVVYEWAADDGPKCSFQQSQDREGTIDPKGPELTNWSYRRVVLERQAVHHLQERRSTAKL